MNYSEFHLRCYALLEKIPKGKVTTYAEIAKALNSKAYRAVGTAMAKNDQLIKRPCHRVIRSDGDIGQYALGTDKKIELLLQEGIEIEHGKVVNLSRFMYYFSSERSGN
ncbi:MAG: MGMT family protein [Methyloprofundus sp.]|nr:MGMT family protein [Methyloprofundus sp.]